MVCIGGSSTESTWRSLNYKEDDLVSSFQTMRFDRTDAYYHNGSTSISCHPSSIFLFSAHDWFFRKWVANLEL